MVETEVIWLALLAFPGTLIGAWLGARTYHALSDRNFRDVVLACCSVRRRSWSGAALIRTQRVRMPPSHGRHATRANAVPATANSLRSRAMPSLHVSRERLGLLLGFIGMAIFGGTLPATRIAVSAIDPLALTALRTAIAGLCSLVLLLVLRRPLPPRRLWPQLAGRDARASASCFRS